MLTLADILEALTSVRPSNASTVVTEGVIDSRQVIPGSLFVAIPGEKVDGHDFIADALRRGASFALIQKDADASYRTLDLRGGRLAESTPTFESPLLLRVDNTLSALQQIARFWRRKLPGLRVVGITGSVGKSTTKEMVAEVLSVRYRTLKSPGNLNNEIGLPLTLLRLGSGYERAVLEMGFYVPGEIQFLCDIAQPQIGSFRILGRSMPNVPGRRKPSSVARANYPRHCRRMELPFSTSTTPGCAKWKSGRRHESSSMDFHQKRISGQTRSKAWGWKASAFDCIMAKRYCTCASR